MARPIPAGAPPSDLDGFSGGRRAWTVCARPLGRRRALASIATDRARRGTASPLSWSRRGHSGRPSAFDGAFCCLASGEMMPSRTAERHASETVGSASWAKGSTAEAHADWSSFACGFISRSAQSERHACLRIAGDASTQRCWITLS